MHEAVVLSFLQDSHRFIVGDEVTTVGLHQIFSHIPHPDAPVAVVVGTAFFQLFAAIAAAAYTHGKMSLITFQPIGDMLNIGSLVHHVDGLLHGNHMHADT